MKSEKIDQIVREALRELYKASTPSADFDELCATCTDYEDMDGHAVTTYIDADGVTLPITGHLPDDVRRANRYRMNIHFDDYRIPQSAFHEIADAVAKRHRLKGYDLQAYNARLYLGPSPSYMNGN